MIEQPPPTLAVTGLAVLSPWADSPSAALTGTREGVGDGQWFDVKTRLGPRGYKYLPPSCQYLLAATRAALADSGGGLERVPETRRGAVVGTNSAISALLAGMDLTVVDGSSDDLSPAIAPFFAVNVVGSRASVEHGIKGFNLTVTSPRVAGMEALEVGSRAVKAGRVSLLVAAATEERPPEGDPGAVDGEQGAVALVLEPAEAAAASGGSYGSCRSRTFLVPPSLVETATGRDQVALVVGRTLAALCDGTAHPPVHLVTDDSPVGTTVRDAVLESGEGAHPVVGEHVAGAGCLEPMVHIAGLFATAESDRVVVTAGAEGNVGLTLVSPATSRSEGP